MRDLNPTRPVHESQIPALSTYAHDTIAHLDLAPHPEGGWFKRTWQSPLEFSHEGHGPRPLASLIYFLLPTGDYSDWHLVDADELWLWHGPGTLDIEVCDTDPRSLSPRELELRSTRTTLTLNAAHPEATTTQLLVKAGQWQRTLPAHGDTLVSCVVSPGFTYDGFEVID
ncbi:cupin domain-containing protein [Alloscardovia venturai]|uniref:Cupin domain-containing protein n=1 Tax=Alloscardovia venturai TaxID=1769421 RepID=A0ABW2YB33_9BIFI